MTDTTNFKNKILSQLGQENLDRLAGIEVSLMAELGTVRVPLKSVLEYVNGTIVNLNKKNNETINIYLDNVLIARGEIVAVNKNFGVKITEIVDCQ
ncbi:FliM/FliN family flagellar motor switch protein [bacterium]|nr:FliM/FliN family flagellar motor switch protein [bacterium]